MPVSEVQGKAIIVTGAGGGIGSAVCALLLKRGAKVIGVDIDSQSNRTVAERLESTGQYEAVLGDTSSESSTEAFVDRCFARFGAVDGVHLNAGVIGSYSSITDMSVEDFDRESAINFRGAFLGIRAAARRMVGGGSIVVTASTAGMSGNQGLAAYTGTKHAAIGLVRAAALDLAGDGIRVNAVCPGETDTPMLRRAVSGPGGDEMLSQFASRIPLGRFADPREIAEAVVWLLGDRSSYVTGSALVVDGGLTAGRFAPRRETTDGLQTNRRRD